LFADVDDVFAPDGRFVVSERVGVATVFQSQQRHVFRRNMLRAHLIRPRFRNVPILTEKAAHVAARRAHAKDTRARQKMIQRLFLDGVNLQRGRRAISQAKELPILIDANETEPRLTGMDVTMAWTKIAVNSSAWLRLPPTGLVQPFCLLEDPQLFHGSSSQTALYLRAARSARAIRVCRGNLFDLQAWRRR